MRRVCSILSLLTALLVTAWAAEAQEVRRVPRRPDLRPTERIRPERIDPSLLRRVRRDLYFSDCRESPGAVYRVQAGKTELYRRSSGHLSSFTFAPWDPDRLYFVNANGREIFEVDLAATTPTESTVYTHSTYVRDLVFDETGSLFFSEASGAGNDGKIWRIDDIGGASLFFTVRLAQIGGFWAGHFGVAPDGTLLLTSGNRVPASVYEADLATGVLTQLYASSSEPLTGFAFDAAEAFYITNHRTNIYTLDLDAGAVTPAYTDAAQEWICDVGFRPSAPVPGGPSVGGLWVMPYGLRAFRVDQIKPSGLVDYSHSPPIVDAPFGGHLGFLLYSANAVPTPQVYYYRLLYRRVGSATWTDFDAPVFVHYVRNRPGTTPVFPLFQLGPNHIGGRNLYRFRPHEAQLPMLLGLPPGIPEWPKIGFPSDIYRGHLNTVALGLAPGKYEVRYEVYNSAGAQTMPGAAFQMIVPTGVDGSGTLLTAPAPLSAGGFQFRLHIDNRSTEAEIAPPEIGATVTDACGFLRYTPANPGQVRLAWHAWHPAGFAVYRLRIVKGGSGIGVLPLPPVPGDPTPSAPMPIIDEVSSTAHHGASGDFFELSPTLRLLDGCREAAFASSLYVWAKAVNGNGVRLSGYDSSDLRAFAIAPR